MSIAANHSEVLHQLTAYGLQVEGLETGQIVRVPTDEDKGRQKSGWYSLHELRTLSGDVVLIGAYGNWRLSDSPQKIKLSGRALTAEEKSAMKARIADDRRRAEAARKDEIARAARRAEAAWKRCSESGECDYLARKQVTAYEGVRFSPHGNIVIPIQDVHGRIYGLQVIYADKSVKKRKGRDKDFWPAGLAKRGHFFLIGRPARIILIAEGYATAASLHAATGWPVAVAFDAGNLLPVAEALRKRYRAAHILLCADDDFSTPGNSGVSSASAAAMAAGGAVVAPKFEADPVRADVTRAMENLPDDRVEQRKLLDGVIAGRPKLTDFNDLAVTRSLAEVGAQVKAAVSTLGWDASAEAPPRGFAPHGGAGGGAEMRPITALDELHERFALVYGHGETVFDFREHILLKLSDMRNACIRRELHRDWMESPEKQIVRIREVGFDPGGQDPNIRCNLWGGWPTSPAAGACQNLLDLLEYMCRHEDNAPDIFQWCLKWLAYPIQHPGAKMKTALVMHGPQGTGKNMFFEAVMAIYGEYGRVIDQASVEDKFNDWASKKLFLLADEVVARQELYHLKGKIKGLITGDWIRINPKNIAAYDERNHVNLVFLSNEPLPLAIDKDDRRLTVIWTPAKLSYDYYAGVKAEIMAGGIAALHDYLLNLDLGDFREWTPPPATRSKSDLIEMSLDSTERFVREWFNGGLDPVPLLPCKSEDFYTLYREWCQRVGIAKYAPQHILLGNIGKRENIKKAQARYINGAGLKMATFVFPGGQVDPPGGEGQARWLSDCVSKFSDGVREWREGAG